MHRENGVHGVSQRRGEAEFRPGHVLALPMGLGPVPPGTHPPSIDPQGQTARHVGDDGREDEERLEREGLVVWPREEEVFVGFPGRLGYQGYETGVGIVHGEVDGGRDGGVFLQAGQDLERGRGRETEEVGRVVRRGWKRLFLDIGGVGRILRGFLVVDRTGFDFVHGDCRDGGAGVAQRERWEIFGGGHCEWKLYPVT